MCTRKRSNIMLALTPYTSITKLDVLGSQWRRIHQQHHQSFVQGWHEWRTLRHPKSRHVFQFCFCVFFLTLRDVRILQSGCFFGKLPNGLCPPPLPIFGNYIALFFAKIRKYSLTCVNLQWFFLDWRWPPPPPPFLDIFSKIYDQNIPFWNQKNLQCNFLDRKWSPPPLDLFQKNIQIWASGRPLEP